MSITVIASEAKQSIYWQRKEWIASSLRFRLRSSSYGGHASQ
jgi:hypothetical protein